MPVHNFLPASDFIQTDVCTMIHCVSQEITKKLQKADITKIESFLV